ncbi:MAG: outer membrane beta-barrel protein [Saprospiraceae bacterium]
MKKLLHFLLLAAAPVLLFGQGDERPRRFLLGALVGFESQTLDWTTLPGGDPDEPARVWADRPKPGASIGVFGAWHLSKSVAVRPQLVAAFTRNRLFFRAGDQSVTARDYRFADLELPVHLVFTNPKGRLPVRGSILLGGRFAWNFAQNQPAEGLRLYHERFALDLGVGLEIHFGKLRLRPEVLYSYGLNNLNDAVETPEYWRIGKAVRDRVSVRVLVSLAR